jgi:flavin-dependent dehydrogenase
MSPSVDILVVGGGPVGLAAAIEARMLGLSVTVVELRESPIDKACGEGLMPGAVTAFDRLGISLVGHPIRGIGYRNTSVSVDHRFVHGSGMGVRRSVLQSALAERAAALGTQFVVAKVAALEQDREGVIAAGIRARYLIGADGLHSNVRSLLGVERPRSKSRRYGLRQHFRVEPWSDLVEVHWTPTAEAYVTPISEDTVGVALLGPQGLNYVDSLAQIPELAARLSGATSASTLRGAGPLRQRTSHRRVGRVLLAGDSSGYVDAITGEGIRVGLAQAEAAVACIAADDVAGYERAWAHNTRDFRTLTAGLVALAGSPLRPMIVPAAAALPRVFGGIVERLAR